MNFSTLLSYVVAFIVVAIGIAYKKLILDKKGSLPTPGLFWFKYLKTTPQDLINYIVSSKEKVVYIREGLLKSYVLVTHPDAAAIVLKEDDVFLKDPDFFGHMKDLTDRSLVNLNGAEYKELKTALSPAFHFNFIKQHISIFADKAGEVMRKWAQNGEDVFVYSHLSGFTLDTLGLTAFGIDFKLLSDGSHEYIQAYKVLTGHPPVTDKVKIASAKKTLADMTDQLIEHKKKTQERSGQSPDFMDLLLTQSSKLSNKEMRDNVFLLFVAGHETTSRALEAALYHLAIYPEMQEIAREEVDTVLKGAVPDAETVRDLTYVSLFIKEVLRIQAPVNILTSRQSVRDFDVLGYRIPKGSKVGVSMHTIHHLEEYWPDHEKFDPLRFSPERSAGRHPFAYLPFSLGRRDCIGNQFSLLEQKIFIAMTLQQFVVTVSPKAITSKIPILQVNWHTALFLNFQKRPDGAEAE